VKYEFIELHRTRFRVTKMCHVLDVSRSAYYAWRKQPKRPRELINDQLLTRIRDVFTQHKGLYGSPRITEELQDQGIRCNHKRVARLMHLHSIVAKTHKRFKVTTHSRHGLPVAPNVLDRNFAADSPNRVWVSDITYIRTKQGWLYLAAILDVYSRHIVGWSMRADLTEKLVLEALNQATGRRSYSPGLIFHSDRGSQYASAEVRALLTDLKFTQSMCGKGNCYDNAMMESFFHTLKTELVHFETYHTRAEAKMDIFSYIEAYYNRVRRHSSLGYLSPLKFEMESNTT
jgi:putative transposase